MACDFSFVEMMSSILSAGVDSDGNICILAHRPLISLSRLSSAEAWKVRRVRAVSRSALMQDCCRLGSCRMGVAKPSPK